MKLPFSSYLLTGILLLFVTTNESAIVTSSPSPPAQRVSRLVVWGDDDGKTLPLILIHGLHGFPDDKSLDEKGGTWKNLIDFIETSNSQVQSKYSIYLFQYRSDVKSLSEIAKELGAWVDELLPDRHHVIVAHSMGGLVAKAYMVEYKHQKGGWQNSSGGDSTIGLITLATPHHGTPGANDAEALEPYFANKVWKQVFKKTSFLVWNKGSGFFSPPKMLSGNFNRSDLRWDNYDSAIQENKLTNFDINIWLPRTNQQFEKYASNVIVYGGFLISSKLELTAEIAAKMTDKELPTLRDRLAFADLCMTQGLSYKFGRTDGNVPLKSALLCQFLGDVITSSDSNFVCFSTVRMRRFEPGQPNDKIKLPDAQTLSITRTPNGYDHEEMHDHPDVLRYVIKDLQLFADSFKRPSSSPQMAAEIPTLFLIDTSGSMSDNNKIEQARTAALDAMNEIRQNLQHGFASPPVAIFSFAGSCNPNSVNRLLPFTKNLSEAENTLRYRLPMPNGETPSPQAMEVALNEMKLFLNRNPTTKDGRIILLSDGQSTCGEVRPAGIYSRRVDIPASQLTSYANRSGNSQIQFLTVGFEVLPGSAAERDLQYLASVSGGRYFNAPDKRQLIRALQKYVRVFVPKSPTIGQPASFGTTAQFEQGQQALSQSDFATALTAFRAVVRVRPNQAEALFNLAQALEATDHYKSAGEYYRRYLEAAPNAPDRAEVQQRILQMLQDYEDTFAYHLDILRSDLNYLKNYYQSLFNRRNEELAGEFIGFVNEKASYYARLADTLEVNAKWMENGVRDLSDSLFTLARRTQSANFDRDAVSLLTLPIGQLEELIERCAKSGIRRIQ